LQVDPAAEPEVIDRAYRALALKYHPDRSAGTIDAEGARMRRMNEAYAVLRDPTARARYDASRSATAAGRSGWDVFWDAGLVGLYLDRRRRRR
ncbi:MAG TPA: J domain-containing protein, partial [Coriobacteriia bacterium]|nr:J domain-containing protein [Coriobacteriia bacterium]